MNTEVLARRFAAIGARVKLARVRHGTATMIDVGTDAKGEFFELVVGVRGVDVNVVDVDPIDRHLLLHVRDGGDRSKFLCGSDERHWFVAAVPESARGVTGVVSAKEALQPDAVREAVARIRPKDRFRRRNTAYVRQGEWFFLPTWTVEVVESEILRNEPITRGRGTPHVLELAFRRGGETVYVNAQHPTGITEAKFLRLSNSEIRNGRWQAMVRDPELYAKGAVRHPDHATIDLHGWHRVLMNTEQGARAMRHVAFLD